MATLEATLIYRSGASEGVILESILKEAQASCPPGFFTINTIHADSPEGKRAMEKYQITNLPSLILPNSKISGSLTEDFIVAVIGSILSKNKTQSDNGGVIELSLDDLPKVNVVSVLLENLMLTREDANIFLFMIKPHPSDFDVDRLKRLSVDRKIFVMTNFQGETNPDFGELNLHENIFVGHIIRDNIYMTSSLIVRKRRPFHSAYLRVKIEDNVKGKWSPLLSDSVKAINTFYLPLFMTSAPINHEGTVEEGQNRVIAKSREAIDLVKQYLKW